jgi:Tfp pilus assembly PilM family ATPase
MIGIDIGSYSLKMIDAELRGGKVRLRGATRILLNMPEQDAAARRAEALKELRAVLYRLNLKPRNVALGVTGRDVNVRMSFIPALRGARGKNLIRYELMQVAGKSEGTVYTDYLMLEAASSSAEKALLVGLGKSSYIDELVAGVEKTGAVVAHVIPNSIALFNAFARCGKWNPGETVMVMELGHENVEALFLRDGKLLFARNMANGAKLFDASIAGFCKVSAAEASRLKHNEGSLLPGDQVGEKTETIRPALLNGLAQLQSVVQSSISFARLQLKNPLMQIDRIVLSGGGARVKGLAHALASGLSKPVDCFDFCHNCDASLIAPVAAEALKNSPSDMTIALGLALGGETGRAHMSLIPEARRKARKLRRQGVPAYAGAALILVATMLLFVLAQAKRESVAASQKDVDAMRTAIEEATQVYSEKLAVRDGLAARVNLLSKVAESGVFCMNVLALVSETCPERLWINKMTLEHAVPQNSTEGKPVEPTLTVVISGYLEESDTTAHAVLESFVKTIDDSGKMRARFRRSVWKETGRFGFEIGITPR